MAGKVRTLAHEGQVPSNGSYRSWLAAAVAPLVTVAAASTCLSADTAARSGPARARDATPVRERSLAFLLQDAGGEKPGAEARAARDLAVKLHGAEVVRVVDDGDFRVAPGSAGTATRRGVNEGNRALSLGRFRIVWYHQGDSAAPRGPAHAPRSVKALRGYVEGGGGLFLSGAALAMVHDIGAETVKPRLGGPGNDHHVASFVPAVPDHPVFRGLACGGKAVPVTDRGYPAFSDFHASGGPTRGMVLARTPSGSENPLAEYQVGKGRVIVMGWRLPHYAHASNPHRANLEKLTANVLSYLAERKEWRKVVVGPRRRRGRVEASFPAPRPGFTEAEAHSLALAVRALIRSPSARYPKGPEFLERLRDLRRARDEAIEAKKAPADVEEITTRFRELRREALLANPLLDFDRLLVVRRKGAPGLVNNWQGNSDLRKTGYDNEIAVLSPVRPGGAMTTLFRPEGGRFVGDVDLDFDASRLLFSMPGANGRWQVCEVRADGTGFRELPLIAERDVDNYDACYLPDGNVIFTSTAPFTGVPCVTGKSHVSNLYRYDAATGKVRRLSFDQDHNWCPTVLGDGRVLYLRWEYSDIPHYVSRILFRMNPDGTGQMEYYGSNSYWPNSMFFARPVPAHPTKFVAVVSGHHDVPRMGELVLFDAAKGRHEAGGVVQRIPGRGKEVAPVILDGLVRRSWPKFLHPYPLSDEYFLVSAQPTSGSAWGLYLVDVFDNMLLIAEEAGWCLLEPVPLRKTTRPPIVPSSVRPGSRDALMYLANVYAGPGLAGVPRGTVKALRLFTYHFAYHGMGGQVNRVGLDGPWDVKRIVGTVPVQADGSALFRAPANTPLSIQPLDARGRALQLMRSWTTAMPGETQSCIGCHAPRNSAPATRATVASRGAPSKITPWYGPTRGFSFEREVQPVLDGHCVGCHDGRKRGDGHEGQVPSNGSYRSWKDVPDFRRAPAVHPNGGKGNYNSGTKFTPSYMALRRYVRSHTIESDMHMLEPMEFHAGTTELVQMLEKGHHGVRLDREAWDRLVTWIDLNTPAHGTWHEIVGLGKVARQRDRRRAMMKRYANIDEDPEDVPASPVQPAVPAVPPIEAETPAAEVTCEGWPFDAAEAKHRQLAGGLAERTVRLGSGVAIELVRVPAGRFVMGEATGHADERPRTAVEIARPFWIGKLEVTNEQFARFDPSHDSRLEHGDFLQFSTRERGYPTNAPRQPVVRVSWRRARAFCRWLSEKTGEGFVLPTEAQWEYACRAGTATPLWYGDTGDDFARSANLADASFRRVDTFGWGLPSGAIPEWRPAAGGVKDGHRVSAPVGSFGANPFGIHDVHGNVWEWTRSAMRPYPYHDDDGRNDPDAPGPRVVRGGSWYDRPARARSAFRLGYEPWQGVYNVGFRVVCEAGFPR